MFPESAFHKTDSTIVELSSIIPWYGMTQWKALGFNPDRCTHIGRGLSGCEAIFQNVARWEPGHRLEAYATLACRRGCRWSADLAAGAFGTSFHTPES